MKRFTETTKWSDPWYQDLSRENKLLWLYLCDCCDSSGVWKVNIRLASFQLGFEVNGEKVLELFGKRIHVLSPEKWFIPSFVKFQYGELSADCRPHKPILELIRSHHLDTLLKGYQSPSVRAKDKDKEKEKDLIQGESEGEKLPESLDVPEFREVWSSWKRHRSQIKKKLTPEQSEASLKKLATFPVEKAIGIIKFTIEKGWQGLAYESQNYGNNNGNHTNRNAEKAQQCRDEGIIIPVLNAKPRMEG